MTWIKNLTAKILALLTTGKAQREAQFALNFVAEALPYIEMAADIATSIIPNKIPKVILDGLKLKYPHLFDGSILTGDELKSYLLSIAASLLVSQNPKLNLTQATLAVQLAYIEAKSNGTIPKIPEAPHPDGILLKVKRPTKSFLEL